MSKTFGKWAILLGLCVAIAFMANTLLVSSCGAETPVRNELRMNVDFTILPMVLPDGTETPAQSTEDQKLGEPEVITSPEEPQAITFPDQEIAKPQPEITPPPPAPITETPTQTLGKVKSVAVKESNTGFVITIQTDRPVTDTSYINLTDPRRLVFDLIGPWKYHDANVFRLNGSVKHIVVGEHPDRLRLVVHFRTPPANSVKPVVNIADTTLTATIALP
nr:AMIN domain-containing protein [uncultured Pseudodesulfovibrio sp.]